MSEKDSKGRRLVTVLRVLEYHGTEEWIKATFQASKIPIAGKKEIGSEGNTFIRSGVVQWDSDFSEGEVIEQAGVIPIPPPGTGSGGPN